MTLFLPHEQAFAREMRREMSADIVYFTQSYLHDEDGQPFKLKDFHIEMLRACADESIERFLLLEPAGFGKSTHVAKSYPLWLVCIDPNVQIILGSKNADDAVMRLGAIKAELEGNEMLVSDWGPFLGELWRDDQINVAQRTSTAKDPTLVAIGSTSSIYGKRATHFIGDDIVTEANSGPQVEARTRGRLERDYDAGVQKVGYPGKRLYIRLVNTVVDQRDLIHKLGDLNQHAPGDMRWTSARRYHVVRRAALDERTMTSLWPERRSVESLLEEKSENPLAFLRRMQNLCLDPLTQPFQRIWFDGDPADPVGMPGCLDHSRCLGGLPQKEGMRTALTAGFDPDPGSPDAPQRPRKNSNWAAYSEVAFDREADRDRTYWVTDLVRFRGTVEDQAKFCAERGENRMLAELFIEDNAGQKWLLQVDRLRTAALNHPIHGHNSNVKNKYDEDVGIPSLAARIRLGRIRFPYHCATCRERTEAIIGEFLAYPEGATTDMVMSLWMAILAAERFVATTRSRVIDPVNTIATSRWVRDRGISVEAIDRYLPHRIMN